MPRSQCTCRSRFRRALALALVSSASTACRHPATAPDDGPRSIEAGEFLILAHQGVSDADASGILGALQENGPRIRAHLRVAEMPRVRVAVWAPSHRSDWEHAMQAATGQILPGATGYTPAADEMRLLLHPGSSLDAVHEYAHLVSWKLNRTIPNNPRWLWEAVAVYEAGVAPDLRTWADADLAFPGFAALNQYNSPLPYRWGYHLARAVIERWGDDGYLALIRANGDLQRALGIGEAAFGAYVEGFVRGVAGRP